MHTATRLLGIGVVLLTVSGLAPTKAGEPDQADVRLKVPRLMAQAGVQGVQIAILSGGKTAWQAPFGLANADTKTPVTDASVFEAASLSKPVFAYAVLTLVDAGLVDLDTPISNYLPGRYDVGDDARLDLITPRHVLSHRCGFPNWRSGSDPLKIHFTPGDRFSYSGEGFVYLAAAVERITGQTLDAFMRRVVFEPLGMASSSYVWQSRYESLKVYNHGLLGDLEAHRALARDDVGVVERRHEHRAALRGELRGDLLPAFPQAVVGDDLGTECQRVLHLHARGVGRHDDRGWHAEQAGRIGDTLRVVARRERHHAGLALRGVELRQAVVCAAKLERAHVLQGLELEQDPSAGEFVERRARERVTQQVALGREERRQRPERDAERAPGPEETFPPLHAPDLREGPEKESDPHDGEKDDEGPFLMKGQDRAHAEENGDQVLEQGNLLVREAEAREPLVIVRPVRRKELLAPKRPPHERQRGGLQPREAHREPGLVQHRARKGEGIGALRQAEVFKAGGSEN